eukprot:552720-Rhodomonas_salina.1
MSATKRGGTVVGQRRQAREERGEGSEGGVCCGNESGRTAESSSRITCYVKRDTAERGKGRGCSAAQRQRRNSR